MTTWILILVLQTSYQNGAITAIEDFQSQEACQKAGALWAGLIDRKYVCLPKDEIDKSKKKESRK